LHNMYSYGMPDMSRTRPPRRGGGKGHSRWSGGRGAKNNQNYKEGSKHQARMPKTLEEAIRRLPEFAMDECGSRFLQSKIKEASEQEKQKVFDVICQEATKLAKDKFGSAVVKLFFGVEEVDKEVDKRERQPVNALGSKKEVETDDQKINFGDAEQKKELAAQLQPEIVPLSMDEYGCRVIQAAIGASEQEQQKVFDVICQEATMLAKDKFGSRVVKLFFGVNKDDQMKKELAAQLQPEIVSLSMDEYGCWVIQAAIGAVDVESQRALARGLEDVVLKCINDKHGNYVIQKCIEKFRSDSLTFIIKAVEGDTKKWAKDKFGCRVIVKLLSHCIPIELGEIHSHIMDDLRSLAQHHLGNYVVQLMLEHGTCEHKQRILQMVSNDIVWFANHKCSSKVVEKCFEILRHGDHAEELEQERAGLWEKALGKPPDLESPIYEIVFHEFGNYVVQSMIEHSVGSERERLLVAMRLHESAIRSSKHGEHVLAVLHEKFGPEPGRENPPH